MRVIVACEFSGRVRDAFIAFGHDAVSVDLLPSESPGPHIVGRIEDVMYDGYDLMVCHPPCTYLCSSGARWWSGRQEEQREAIDFAWRLMLAPIPRICLENPVGILSNHLGKPNQIVHPHWFGDNQSKATCLWLKGLTPLPRVYTVPSHCVESYVHNHPESRDRWKNRSRTPWGLAHYMAEFWG